MDSMIIKHNSPTTIPNAPKVSDFGLFQNSGGCSIPMGTTIVLVAWGAIHQLLNIILQLRILVLLLVSTLPYVVKVKNYT
jgi:hypothetical protein